MLLENVTTQNMGFGISQLFVYAEKRWGTISKILDYMFIFFFFLTMHIWHILTELRSKGKFFFLMLTSQPWSHKTVESIQWRVCSPTLSLIHPHINIRLHAMLPDTYLDASTHPPTQFTCNITQMKHYHLFLISNWYFRTYF